MDKEVAIAAGWIKQPIVVMTQRPTYEGGRNIIRREIRARLLLRQSNRLSCVHGATLGKWECFSNIALPEFQEHK
ncbi:hypothetical protein J2X43_003556 [Rhizobium sp. BE258]|nr:hypothetical protein [Rhizobium sp. BE258]